jgi:ABC-type amino acid transport substrate-binding protein
MGARRFLAACMAAASAMVMAEPVPISVGEQPPLFSSKGGIIDMVASKALARGGLDARLEWLPIGRMLALLQEDALDVYITPSNTPGQQNPHVSFLEARGVFFYVKDRFPSLKAARLEDLAGKRVGTVVNSPLKGAFEKAGIIVDEGPYESLFEKLDAGRIDFAATADVAGILIVHGLFPGRESEFALTELSYSAIGAGLYVKDRPDLAPILAAARAGFAAMKADGSLKTLLQSFFGPEWKRVRILD